jgi:twitching motility protein PilT
MDINGLLEVAMQWGASDVHFGVPACPMLRLCTELIPFGNEPLTPLAVKEVFESITTEKQREAFYGELELDFAYSISGIGRFRVNASMQRGSIALAIRCLPVRVPSIDELGLPDICKSLILKRKGLVLVTGPTSSGKSTTQAAMIDYLNERESRKIVTVEDPIEYLYSNKKSFIVQRDLGDDTLSFAAAMRHALRQNADVILVGEMRDVATTAAAINAAETGHLVLATAHTQGAADVIDRLISEFPPSQHEQIRVQLAITLEAVLSQILVPRVDGKGRVAAFEILMANYAIRNLIRERKIHQIATVIETSSQTGMQTLDNALGDLVRKGIIDAEEALLRAQRPEQMEKDLLPYFTKRRKKTEPEGKATSFAIKEAA